MKTEFGLLQTEKALLEQELISSKQEQERLSLELEKIRKEYARLASEYGQDRVSPITGIFVPNKISLLPDIIDSIEGLDPTSSDLIYLLELIEELKSKIQKIEEIIKKVGLGIRKVAIKMEKNVEQQRLINCL